jgi:hypothetical protein
VFAPSARMTICCWYWIPVLELVTGRVFLSAGMVGDLFCHSYTDWLTGHAHPPKREKGKSQRDSVLSRPVFRSPLGLDRLHNYVWTHTARD